MALSAAVSMVPKNQDKSIVPENSPKVRNLHSNSLYLQVSKVVSAHASSFGDSLIGVPLLCASGLPHEAVGLLQDSGLWNYAAALTASTLDGYQFAISCMRWAQNIIKDEGDLWRAVGILAAGGCLKEVIQVI